MRTQGKRNGEQLSVSHTLRHVHEFILRAVEGDTVAASALFQRYLAGELPEELLALSRRCVQEDKDKGVDDSTVQFPKSCLALATAGADT